MLARARKTTVTINEKGTDYRAKLSSNVPLGNEFSDLYCLFELIQSPCEVGSVKEQRLKAVVTCQLIIVRARIQTQN